MQNVTRNAQKNKIADFGRQKHKNTSQPIFVKKVFVPLCILYTGHCTFYNALKYLSLFPNNGPKSKEFPFFTIFLCHPQKNFSSELNFDAKDLLLILLYPKLPMCTLEVDLVTLVWPTAPPKFRKPRFLAAKRGPFWGYFWT